MIDTVNRTALVTGSSRGIGATIAQRLAADGFNVIVNYADNEMAANEVVAKIEAVGRKAIAAKVDVSDAVAVRRMFDSAEAAFGGVNVVVNNAGIMKLAKIADSDDALFDSQAAINFKGTFNLLREAAVRLRDGGRIVNLSSSIVGLYPENYGVYAAIKAGVEAMTMIMAKELRGRSITVNAVAPGPTATDLFLDGKPDDVIAKFSKAPPLERLGRLEDIANVVSFLVGPDGAWVNGQTVRANGGLV